MPPVDRRGRYTVDQTLENKIEQLYGMGNIDYTCYNILLNAFKHLNSDDSRKTSLVIKHDTTPTGERSAHFSFTITIEGDIG